MLRSLSAQHPETIAFLSTTTRKLKSQAPELNVEMPNTVDAIHQEQLEDPMEDEQQPPQDPEDVEHGGS